MSLSFALNEAQKEFLGKQALKSVGTALEGKAAQPLEPAREGGEDEVLTRELGSFVTINKNGSLRGCIGTIIGREPLYLNVWNMARAAAFNDPRFPPINPAEWPELKFEITVLDQPRLCQDPSRIVIGRDGLILAWRGRSGVFLPQVPVEQGWDLDAYLNHLCLKAGVPIGAWNAPDAELYWYQALAFPAQGEK